MASALTTVVETTAGSVRGLIENDAHVFRGIPYAATPTGTRRFRPPALAAVWEGERDATRFGPVCLQPPMPGIFGEIGTPPNPSGDDCLNLNVWTPDVTAMALPVLVWIHGGAFYAGSGIDDVYNGQRIFKEGVLPRHLLDDSKNYRPECEGFSPPQGVWAHICGCDLVRDDSGKFFVLEDNLRVPSGVAYMLENREVSKRVLPEFFENNTILPVDNYPSMLLETLSSVSPRSSKPVIVILTPGIFNSAYFEHAFLAQQMGVELVEGGDLVVDDDDYCYMKTIDGLERVDVIYRRIDDMFLDPEVFNKESVLGVPGLMRAWKAGKVAIVNAPGAGVADDKVVYAYVPKMIEFYLGEKAILPNVKTWLCDDPKHREYVLEHIEELVVKPANESGGYGMLVGPHASKKDHEQFRKLVQENPRNYIAQPTLSLSTTPVITGPGEAEPRHLDLRPFVLQGKKLQVTTGGLTRVALRKGSLVVNSSQGGGSKDTWIVRREER